MDEQKWEVDEWTGCYPSNWKGLIVPEAMSHPAKFSNRLIRRIYEHMKEEGWLKAGDTVIDPFGGVALGGLDAMRMGLRWVGCELEPKFVERGNWNISHWNAKFHRMPNWSGDAVLLQGDSRKLLKVISDQSTVQVTVSSPPFEQRSADGGWQMFGKYAQEGKLTVKQVKGDSTKSYPSWDSERDTSYGDSDGQMANMKSTEEGFSAAVGSPPYADSDLNYKKNGLIHDGEHYERPYMEGQGDETYGATPGKLAGMKNDGFDAAVSSPPYKNDVQGGGLNVNKPATFRGVLKDGTLSMGESDGNLGMMDDGNFEGAVSSPPYNLPMSQEHNGKRGGQRGTTPSEYGAFVKYGNTEGQLEGMKSSDETFNAAISSPPFLQSEGGMSEPKPGGVIDERLYARHAAGNSAAEGYGGTEGQLGNMREVSSFELHVSGSVSSPPYEAQVVKDRSSHLEAGRIEEKGLKGQFGRTGDILAQEAYGHEDGQLADETGDDFWLAARAIVEQVYLALEPGGHAAWVCKRYVKNKKIVEFSDQWRQLCESVGFKTIHWHRAMLVRGHGKSITLEGGEVDHQKSSKSFFRRLAEKNGSPKIDWEDVLCMVKE